VLLQHTDIFISYSHKDREWLERLQVHLKPLFRDGGITVWDDTKLPPGALWSEEIDQALRRCVAAVLLLSPYFFASKFIMEVEWPELQKAARERGLKILPISVSASAVFATEVGAYQGLMALSKPLDLFTPAEQNAQLVTIARKIRQEADRARVAVTPRGPGQQLTPLRTFEVGMARVGPCMFDDEGRLWVSNWPQVKVFRIDQEQPVERWFLPDRRWKTCAPEIWASHLVMSDWEGSLYRFSNHSRDGLFAPARHDSVPFHLIAAAPDGQLVTAAWDGCVRRWNADGTLAGEALMLDWLPLDIVPLPDAALAAVDQASNIHVFDPAGSEIWSWCFGEPVRMVWCTTEGRKQALAVLGAARLVKIAIGEDQPLEQGISGGILKCSRRHGPGDEWGVIASERRIEWLSMSSFNLVRDTTVAVDFDIREIAAVPAQDMASQHIPVAVGLTDRGQMFSAQENRITVYDDPAGIDQLLMAPSGRFLFLRSASSLAVYRNPAIVPGRCRVRVAGTTGTLAVTGFKKLQVRLENSGSIPIHHLKAELHAEGIIDRCTNTRAVPLPIAPGEPVELEFAVRAQVSGDAVPLNLYIELADEGGSPFSVEELRLSVESVGVDRVH
jgi:TIR domain